MAKEKRSVVRPLILRFHRIMDAFAKSDDERDFYLSAEEGFLLFLDLDKNLEDLDGVEQILLADPKIYRQVPKMTFYETKKFMEGFVHEKVYDIDTKEKLLDIIQSREARENFLEFIYDNLTELEKWQQYYHERSRVRIIEWLRDQEIQFVFEEDLDVPVPTLEKLKHHFFDPRLPKDVHGAFETIVTKSKTYYSSEALNPRPKRGRPPKQTAKVEVEPELSVDVYKRVPPSAQAFLYKREYSATSFSAKFDTEAQLIASLRGSSRVKIDSKLEALSQRLESLRHLSDRLKASQGLGLEDEKFIDGVGKRELQAETVEKGGKRRRVAEIAKGFLPKKRGRPPKEKAEIQEMLQKKRKAGIKQVTQIKSKPKKGEK